MSDGHGGHEQTGDVPVSHGISPWMKLFLVVSVVIVVWQGSNVVRSSDDAHVWPSSNAATVKLPPEAH